jgi:uncharacterized protein with PQ loop repeat
MDYQNIFGYVATGLSGLFYCSLVIPFFNVLRCKLNYEFTPIALIDTVYVDSVAWYIYADKILCDQLKCCSLIGGACSLALISIYLAFEFRKYTVDSILNCLILILGTLVMHKGLTIVIHDSEMVGKICIATKCLTYLISLFNIYKVIKEKNYAIISVNSTLTYLASCIGWAIFGKAVSNSNLMAANCIGVVVCLIQFVVYLNVKKKYPSGHYGGSSSTIGIESSTEESKTESTTMTIDEEKEDKAKEKPVKIITRIDN